MLRAVFVICAMMLPLGGGMSERELPLLFRAEVKHLRLSAIDEDDNFVMLAHCLQPTQRTTGALRETGEAAVCG